MSFRTKSNTVRKVKTPGGKLVLHYTGKKGKTLSCGEAGCAKRLDGVRHSHCRTCSCGPSVWSGLRRVVGDGRRRAGDRDTNRLLDALPVQPWGCAAARLLLLLPLPLRPSRASAHHSRSPLAWQIPALRPVEYSRISKRQKTVSRAYGGSKCAGCVRTRCAPPPVLHQPPSSCVRPWRMSAEAKADSGGGVASPVCWVDAAERWLAVCWRAVRRPSAVAAPQLPAVPSTRLQSRLQSLPRRPHNMAAGCCPLLTAQLTHQSQDRARLPDRGAEDREEGAEVAGRWQVDACPCVLLVFTVKM